MFLSWPQQCAFTILMSGQSASQDWRPASRNQRRRLDQNQQGEVSATTLPQHSSYSRETSRRWEFTGMSDISWMIWWTQTFWIPPQTTGPTTTSLTARSAVGKLHSLMIHSFRFIVLMLRDTLLLSHREKTSSCFINCWSHLHPHCPSYRGIPFWLPLHREEEKWEPCRSR